MVLPQGETHLVVAVVVRLVVGPVKPADRLVHVVPGPGAGLVLAVPALEEDGEGEEVVQAMLTSARPPSQNSALSPGGIASSRRDFSQ